MATMSGSAFDAEFDYESYLPPDDKPRACPRPEALVLSGGWHAKPTLGAASRVAEGRVRRAVPGVACCANVQWASVARRALPKGLPWTAYPVTPPSAWRWSASGRPHLSVWADGRWRHAEGPSSFPEVLESVSLIGLSRVAEGEMGFGPAAAEVDHWMGRVLALVPAAAASLPLIALDEDGDEPRGLPPIAETAEALRAPWVPTERLLYQYHVNSLSILAGRWRRPRAGSAQSTFHTAAAAQTR